MFIKWLINLDENQKILIKNGYNQLHKFEFIVTDSLFRKCKLSFKLEYNINLRNYKFFNIFESIKVSVNYRLMRLFISVLYP
jgi:hypothetical protein